MKLFKLLYVLVCICYFPTTYAQVSNSLLYEISGNDLEKPSYLFGTYHLINSEFVKDKPRVYKAYQEADQVVVETEIDSSQLLAFTMKAMMPGKSLKTLLDEETYATIQEEVKNGMQVDLAMFDQFKPAYISTLLAVMYTNENNPWLKKYQGQPMDAFFAQEGKKQSKKVHLLETMMDQAEVLFSGTTVEEQAEDLKEMVNDKKATIELTQKLGRNYTNENLTGLEKLGEEYKEQYGEMTELVDDRNIKWMDQLPQILSDGNAFIAVGALHLPGEKGLINLLQAKGYTVKPVMP